MTVTGKKALLVWCQDVTEGYPNVQVKDFSKSWKNGLAFCAIIHRYRPQLLDFYALDPNEASKNLQLAFEAAEKAGIKPLLDVEDIVDFPSPDSMAITTYVAQFYQAFANTKPEPTVPKEEKEEKDEEQVVPRTSTEPGIGEHVNSEQAEIIADEVAFAEAAVAAKAAIDAEALVAETAVHETDSSIEETVAAVVKEVVEQAVASVIATSNEDLPVSSPKETAVVEEPVAIRKTKKVRIVDEPVIIGAVEQPADVEKPADVDQSIEQPVDVEQSIEQPVEAEQSVDVEQPSDVEVSAILEEPAKTEEEPAAAVVPEPIVPADTLETNASQQLSFVQVPLPDQAELAASTTGDVDVDVDDFVVVDKDQDWYNEPTDQPIHQATEAISEVPTTTTTHAEDISLVPQYVKLAPPPPSIHVEVHAAAAEAVQPTDSLSTPKPESTKSIPSSDSTSKAPSSVAKKPEKAPSGSFVDAAVHGGIAAASIFVASYLSVPIVVFTSAYIIYRVYRSFK